MYLVSRSTLSTARRSGHGRSSRKAIPTMPDHPTKDELSGFVLRHAAVRSRPTSSPITSNSVRRARRRSTNSMLTRTRFSRFSAAAAHPGRCRRSRGRRASRRNRGRQRARLSRTPASDAERRRSSRRSSGPASGPIPSREQFLSRRSVRRGARRRPLVGPRKTSGRRRGRRRQRLGSRALVESGR